jgi:hypothetical protein
MASIIFGVVQFDRYRGLYEAAPRPRLLPNPAFTIIEANSAYQRATMTDIESVRGRYLPDKTNDPSADGVLDLSRSLQVSIGEPCVMLLPVLRHYGRNRKWRRPYW